LTATIKIEYHHGECCLATEYQRPNLITTCCFLLDVAMQLRTISVAR
jgi:hypothetical protein